MGEGWMRRMLPPRARRAFHLGLRGARRADADVEDELRLHLELRAEQLVARGWSQEDAMAEARRRFGGGDDGAYDDAVRTLKRSGRAREERLAMRDRLDVLWQDLRYVVRGFARAPRFALAAALTLALGLGATTVVFTFVDHVVLRPLPYRDPGQLVVVREVVRGLDRAYPSMPANASHFLRMRDACGACTGMAAVKRASVTITGDGDPQRVGAPRVSAAMFRVLGVAPAIGRDFRDEEETPGNDRVVLLSDAFWRRQFGADPSVVGTTLHLSDVAYEVIGVLPPGAGLPPRDGLGALVGLPDDIALYRPLALSEREAKTQGEFDYGVVARLRPGATPERARAQLDAVAAKALQEAGEEPGRLRIQVASLQDTVVGGAGRPLFLVMAAVLMVLLLVCANLTGLALARNAGRMGEFALRVALGASRARLVRLALAESLLLAVAGGALGLLVAWWGVRTMVAIAPATLPRLDAVALDTRVFVVAAAIALVVGTVIGLVPALSVASASPGGAMRGAAGRTTTAGRAVARRRSLFITAQVAVGTVLLVGAGLFVSSLVRVLGADRGFEAERVLAVNVPFSYGEQAKVEDFYRRALDAVAAVPGVTSVAATNGMPLEGETWVDGISTDEVLTESSERVTSNLRFVTPGFLATVGTPLRRGRDIAWEDRGRRVAVVSERTARTLWPGQDAIGQRVNVGPTRTSAEVVGIAADVRTSSLEQEGSLVVYVPAWEAWPWQGTIAVRTGGDPATMAPAVRAALRAVDPTVPVARVRTMREVVSAAVAARRFQVALLSVLAVMAFVMASLGIYGVIAQSLAARTGEIGVRLALGARPRDVHGLVLREGMTPVAVGLALGVAASVTLGRAVAGLLYEVRPADPVTLLAVVALLGVVGIVACAIPSRRATSVDLTRMLRAE